MELRGFPPKEMIRKSPKFHLFFDSKKNPRPVYNKKGEERIPNSKSLAKVVKSNDVVFLDFIDKCLQ